MSVEDGMMDLAFRVKDIRINELERELARWEKLLCDVYLDIQGHDIEDAKRRLLAAGVIPR